MTPFDHRVQFYESEQFLSSTVTDYLAEGLAARQVVVVIATEPRRKSFASGLKHLGIDTDTASRDGFLRMLDARDTIDRFMRKAVINPKAFVDTLTPFLKAPDDVATRVRAYGEMVDLLWKDGNREAAIKLEELWNGLGATHSFSLLCGYEMGNFHSESDEKDFRRICSHHSDVTPTEAFTGLDPLSQRCEITRLQQRASALEAEIAHRRQLEQRLLESLAERDMLLEREQAARVEAEKANRAKSDFLAVMSHELRTPLNAIGGHVQLVQMGLHGPVTATQREALQRVERSQRHLLALINDLLNLVKIESGKVEYSISAFPIAPVLKDTASLVEPLLEAGDLHCEIALNGAATAEVRADPEKLQQILLNLLTNAIKFTAPMGRIVIEGSAVDAEMLSISIRDTGVGIPKAKLDSIFEPFVQLGVRPQSGQEGLGLGLAISRDLACGMGGDIRASSEIGKGTTFTLTLPRSCPS